MDEARLLEIERTMGEWVKVKELIAEIRRCWSYMREAQEQAQRVDAILAEGLADDAKTG